MFSQLHQASGCGDQRVVKVRAQKSRIGVFLHEAVHNPLGLIETGSVGCLHFLPDEVSGLVVNVNLEKYKGILVFVLYWWVKG